jgi:hypothetical protein
MHIYVSHGNLSEDKDVTIFNLPAIKTCPNHTLCGQACYARKAEKRFKAVVASRERNLSASKASDFVDAMVKTLAKAKKVRIHESGDFYSGEYTERWRRIIQALPSVRFKCFTKVEEAYRTLSKLPNLAIHLSVLPDGSVNFGTDEEMDDLAKKYMVAFICPKKRAKTHECSKFECTECFNKLRKYILFTKH